MRRIFCRQHGDGWLASICEQDGAAWIAAFPIDMKEGRYVSGDTRGFVEAPTMFVLRGDGWYWAFPADRRFGYQLVHQSRVLTFADMTAFQAWFQVKIGFSLEVVR